MIGKIIIGKSFRGCINYCLHDKPVRNLEQEQVMKDRAEVLCYNQCYGNSKELIAQFREVRQLNPRLAKPVLHITLGLAPGEKLPAHMLAEIAHDCAIQLGFDKNQFLAVWHKDTSHQHLHVIANRIGFDGKTWSDSNSYKKIADFCRKMEVKYDLQQVLSPKRYLPKEKQEIPRLDHRKLKLQADIKVCLTLAKDYRDFEQMMKSLRYEVIRARGIAFRDQQKVYTKGSEVGYSLSTIEKLLALKPELRVALLGNSQKPGKETSAGYRREQKSDPQDKIDRPISHSTTNHLSHPQPYTEAINPALLKEARKRRKRKPPRL